VRVLEEYSMVRENDGVELRYFYRITKSQYCGFPAYGVEIERKDYLGLRKIKEEKDSIEFVSTQMHKVKQIVMNLCNYEVSPIHLVDILGEFVDEHVYEFDMILSKEAQLI
jgi:hypothetical protein